jgi:uncharacterized OsmC-like protein
MDITTKAVSKDLNVINAGFENAEPLKVAAKGILDKHPGAWSPVHMLVSAVETCFWVTFGMIAEKARVEVRSVESEAEGVIEAKDGRHFAITGIKIRPIVQLVNESDRPKLPELYKKAEEYCVVGNTLNIRPTIASH